MAKEPTKIPPLAEFLFKTPLYEPVIFPAEEEWFESSVYSLLCERSRVDGYCRDCERDVTFVLAETSAPTPSDFTQRRVPYARIADGQIYTRRVTCLRNMTHHIDYFFRKDGLTLEKVGQSPSLADFALADLKEYRSLLKEDDNGKELYRAIGLAAHGVGIGSFVYLRRVFERLIYRAFETGKVKHGWSEDSFLEKRMSDRVTMVAPELPDFLVEHASLYGILSKGIHELTEEECLGYFAPVHQSILLILEQERERERKAAMKESLSKAVKEISRAETKPKPPAGK